MAKYRVGALVTGLIYDDFNANSEEEAKEMMCDKYGDKSINICSQCSEKVFGLSVVEDIDEYEIEDMD